MIGVLAQQSMVGRWRSITAGRERFPCPALRQLQHGARLVFDLITRSSPRTGLRHRVSNGLYRSVAALVDFSKLGDQPVSASIAAYYNVARPTGTPDWQLRAALTLLFPEK